ncbi:MAG TPA: tetratricopeptide repeat protein [Bradyrhizobium sp.]|jgi:tetratricopeptide (TPR) repeat protein|uniref:tetratricopeptide repeat protein n=1 Tax=Bradyrhizobium sp. TaxID=376 RepID=UPI002B997D97|nr:tetratricopeptide repeat protein [Bradyrhizobium sp.]HTB03633.1 tetratricopeptide repeat protein [Bradyrhizobium sp.]
MNRKQRRIAEAAGKRSGAQPSDPRVAGLFAMGLAHHQAGRLAQAETFYRETLALQGDHADALHLLGVIASQVGRHDVAVDLIGRAIAHDRGSPLYHGNHGLALAGLQRFEEAIESYDRALSLRPGGAEMLYNRGNALVALGRPHDALEAYGRALLARPDYTEALCNRGAALTALGRHDEALESYDRALAVVPDFSAALSNRGNALKALGRLDEALADYDRALTARPDDAQALFNRGVTLHELKRFELALESYDRALAVRPDHAEALSNRGDALRELGRPQDALESYDRALAARPDYAEAFSNRGNLLKALRRFDDALESYDAALRLRADDPAVQSNRAVTLQALDRLDEALASCDRALALDADRIEALINRASVLQELRRFDEALATYDRAAAIAPDHAEAQTNRALLLLLTGDMARGWPAYEWRRKLPSWVERGFTEAEWSGEDIAGKRLLLHAEQGFGDTIQFARYAAQAASRGADVVLEVQPSLAPLLSGLFGIEVVAAGRDPLPAFDLHCPLLSLPRLHATTPATIPGGVPYIVAPADRIAAWAPRLPAEGLRVGLAWSGHPNNVRDHERSIPFARLASLIGIPGTRFVSLQKDIRAADAGDFRRCGDVIELGDRLRDFADTAAVIAQLDLVITVDTAVAHLAGAMGKPVWVLLPRIPDFRWLLDRPTSPWYPSARLFRKGRADSWDAVVAGVATELAARAAPAVGLARSA